MHFAVGTTNKPKSAAIEHVLINSPYTSGATFSNYSVSSGVPDMPTTLAELRNGAKNRAVFTRREKPDADYFV
jgi:non-canonical (house-cleaning) NTP pyrophosphatase